MATGSIKKHHDGGNARSRLGEKLDGERLALSVADAAAASGLSQSYLRDEITRGHLPAVRKGRRLLVRVRDLDAYLRS